MLTALLEFLVQELNFELVAFVLLSFVHVADVDFAEELLEEVLLETWAKVVGKLKLRSVSEPYAC